MSLVDALGAEGRLTAVVGAGGKKTTLYALADRLDRTVLTATVRIPIFDREVSRVTVTDDPLSAVEVAADSPGDWPLGLVPRRCEETRYEGYEPSTVDRVAASPAVESTLVKADGARTRLLKAPGEHEPQIPETTDVVLALASVRAVGKRLDAEIVHRPERVAAITDLDVGDRITPEAVATILAQPEGGRKDVPARARYVPVLNMVDDPVTETNARRIGTLICSESTAPDRVVCTRMIDDDPVVDVIDGRS